MSLIVVEGVDASGKSTLLEQARIHIPKRYFVQVRHSCRPLQLGDALSLIRMVDFTSFHCGLDIIADRHPLISEPIYGPILRGSHLFEQHLNLCDEEHRIDDLRNSVDRVIYCRPPRNVIFENVGRNPQLVGVQEKLHELIEKYDYFMTLLQDRGIKVICYDWTDPCASLEDLFFGELR